MPEWSAVLAGPGLTIVTGALLFILKWLYDIRASQGRIEARQLEDGKKIRGHDTAIDNLKQRTAGLEGAVFKRPVIIEEEQ